VIFYIGLYRCRNECPADLFLDIEEQLYKIRKYLLLTAATGATTSLAVAALLTPLSIPLEPPVSQIQTSAVPGIGTVGTQPNSSVQADETAACQDAQPSPTKPAPRGGSSPASVPEGEATTVGSSSGRQPGEGEATQAPRAGTAGPVPPHPAGGQPDPVQDAGSGGNPFRWSSLLGTLVNGVAEALGLDTVVDQRPYASAVGIVVLVNMLLMPLAVIYLVWPLWIPQLPALQLFIRGSLAGPPS
jgi:hypothetical protein